MSGDVEVSISSSQVVRWTVDTRDPSRFSSTFRFQGDAWYFYYDYHDNEEDDDDEYVLGMKRESGECQAPFDVDVQVEDGGGTDRTLLEGLSEQRHFEGFNRWDFIWMMSGADILRADPEFDLNNHQLRFLVQLKTSSVLADVRSTATQTEDSGEFLLPTASPASVQTACHLPDAAEIALIPVQTTLLWNTPDCLESLSQDFCKMLDCGSDPDVEFQCSGQSTGAHGAVVSARSEVIASMLGSGMVEGRTRVVKIPNMEPDVFRHFLRYIYTGSLPELSPDLALDLYEAGDQYAVSGLTRRCSKFLLEHLTVDNACRVLVVADAHSDEAFRESVIGFVLERQVPLSGADWREFCRAHPNLANEVLNRFCLKLSQ